MSQKDRKRYDIEMEDWADQHDKKKKNGFYPLGLKTKEGKTYWKSMSWSLNFEWNYTQKRHQITESKITEEEELKRILHCLADFQDSPPDGLPESDICSIEKAYITSANYLCRRLGRPSPINKFNNPVPKIKNSRSPITFFIIEEYNNGQLIWRESWIRLRQKSEVSGFQKYAGSFFEFKKTTVNTSKGPQPGVQYEEDGGIGPKSISRADFGRIFRSMIKKLQTKSDSPK